MRRSGHTRDETGKVCLRHITSLHRPLNGRIVNSKSIDGMGGNRPSPDVLNLALLSGPSYAQELQMVGGNMRAKGMRTNRTSDVRFGPVVGVAPLTQKHMVAGSMHVGRERLCKAGQYTGYQQAQLTGLHVHTVLCVLGRFLLSGFCNLND